MWGCLVAAALAAPPAWRDAPSDVLAQVVTTRSPAELSERLVDLRRLAALYPADCTAEWVHGAASEGPSASARVTYRIAGWRRRLTVRYATIEPERVVQIDHEGKKGFVTQWVFDVVDGKTTASMGTYVAAPPWPFRRFYVFRVQPAWVDCQRRTLETLVR
jgi:hypothetical protein